jgi:hypothetical protein
MKNLNNEVFLNKIGQRVKNGDFDTYLTLPFMTRELLFSSLRGKINKKISTGTTPILNDTEIKDCLAETKETAAYIICTYLKLGFISRTETGYEFTEDGYKIMRLARSM